MIRPLLKKDLKIENNISEHDTVHIDPRVFKTIIRNLISNAVKFSFEEGTIEFSSSQKTGMFKLQVSDNGIGLEGIQKGNPEIDTLREKNAGSGIGIKICKELAAKSDVILELTANPKGGTVGTVKIPIAA